MPTPDLVVVGASAGGVEALRAFVQRLPSDLPAAVGVVLHVPASVPSALPAILTRSGTLPASHAVDGERIQLGHIYVAPPNHHLVVRPGQLRVVVGPRENGVRPSVDVLFRAAARTYGRRTIGVVLSGTLSDGALGLAAIKLRGGAALVQDPDEALFEGMPRSALGLTSVDACAPVAELALLVDELTRQELPDSLEETGGEQRMGEMRDDEDFVTPVKRDGEASGLTCPECYGSIWALPDGSSVRFECRVGHAYSAEAFTDHQGERVEAALWTAVNLLHERAATFRHLADSSRSDVRKAGRYAERADETERHAEALRGLLVRLVQAGDVD